MNKEMKTTDVMIDKMVKEYTLEVLEEVNELMTSEVFSTGDYKRDERLLRITGLLIDYINIENKEGK